MTKTPPSLAPPDGQVAPDAITASGGAPPDPATAWIEARMAEFAADPAQRDRALATVLYNQQVVTEQFVGVAEILRKKGVGGLVKEMFGALTGLGG